MRNDINADEFTYQCINSETNEILHEGKGKSYNLQKDNMKILIFTKNDIKELFNKIKDIVGVKSCSLMKSEGQIITESGNIINIRKLSESARGYRANVVLYDGKFTNEERKFMEHLLLPNGMIRKLQI